MVRNVLYCPGLSSMRYALSSRHFLKPRPAPADAMRSAAKPWAAGEGSSNPTVAAPNCCAHMGLRWMLPESSCSVLYLPTMRSLVDLRTPKCLSSCSIHGADAAPGCAKAAGDCLKLLRQTVAGPGDVQLAGQYSLAVHNTRQGSTAQGEQQADHDVPESLQAHLHAFS